MNRRVSAAACSGLGSIRSAGASRSMFTLPTRLIRPLRSMRSMSVNVASACIVPKMTARVVAPSLSFCAKMP